MSNKNVFLEHIEKDIVEYNLFLNFVIGLLAFSMGITAILSKEFAAPIATISFIFLLVCIISKQILLGNKIRRYYQGYTFLESLYDQIKFNLPYLTGFTFVGLIAFGVIDLETFKNFSFAHWYK